MWTLEIQHCVRLRYNRQLTNFDCDIQNNTTKYIPVVQNVQKYKCKNIYYLFEWNVRIICGLHELQ